MIFWVVFSTMISMVLLVRESNSQAIMALSAEVKQICDDYWHWRLEDRPQFATFVGIHDYNELLDDLSEEAYDARHNKSAEFLNRIGNLEGSLKEEQDIINIEILKEELTLFNEGLHYQSFFFPVYYFEGPQSDYQQLFGWMPKKSVDDYMKIILRMEKIPQQVDQMTQLMRRGLETGKVLHSISLKSVNEKLKTFITDDPTENPLYKEFFDDTKLVDNFTSSEIETLQNKTSQTIVKIVPAYQRLLDFLTDEYVTRPEIAATTLPNGEDFYKQLIKHHTSTTYSPQEIHDIGLKEVNKIEAQMKKVIQEYGQGNMSVPEFSAMIRDDPKNYYKTKEELLGRFNDVVHKIIGPKLQTIFNYIPKAKLKVEETNNPDNPGAFYYSGSFDGSRPGTFLVNAYELTNQPKYGIITLSLHEGNPGHHLQNSHNMESDKIPFFRRTVDDRNYNLPPSSFPLNTAYAEGWGLYSESLGFDLGLYDDLLDRYGHYSDEIFRACRLVVDTGMHALGWSKQQAVDYMLKYTAQAEESIINEVDRYISWPGQALGYKMGEIKIQELRKKAETQLGSSFNIKEFHDVVLDSSGPMNIVQKQIDKWIQKKMSNKI